MACLKDEVKRSSSRSRIFVYEDSLQYLDPDDIEGDLEKALDYSREAFLIASKRMSELGLTVIDTPADINKIVNGAPNDLENSRNVVPLSIGQELYSKIQERRGEIWVGDFLDTVIGYRKEMARLDGSRGETVSVVKKQRSRASQDDSEEEEDEEDPEEENSYDEPVSVSFLGKDVDFDNTSKILWIIGIALFGVGDTATTFWSLKMGNVETNPILAFLIGMNPLIMISFKLAIICAFYVFYSIMKNRNGKDSSLLWIPIIMIILGGYLTINNLLVIFRS